MDKNLLNPGVVPIRALLAGIEVVGDLKKKRQASFAIVSIDDEKIAKSEKKSEPAPQWEWKDLEFRFHPSSKIKIVIYRESRTRIDFAKHLAGQYTGKVSELLNNDATFDLKDEHGAEVTSKSKIKINLCLVPESKDTFEIFMKSVDDNISHMKSGVLASAGNTLILGGLGTVLQLTKSIMDAVAGTHPILGASWSVMSAVYTAVQQTEILDDSVRALADTLRETLGIAKEKPDLLLIKGTDNVIEEIGRTSLKVASLIHEYTRLPFPFRAAKFQLSDDMKSRIAQCQQTCDDLKQKFDRRVNMDTNLQLKIIKDDQLARDIQKWLDAPDSSRNYNDARKKHQKDTCSWFLDGERFREFQERADFLWIKGKAGSGKTILCSSIIDKIKKLHEENPSTTYAYFFFDGRDAQKDLQLHDKLIRSLISQLWVQCDGIPATLVELYNQHGHGNQQPSTNSLENILYNIINGMHSTYVIIDSLDECIERGETLVWIKGIQTPKISTLHMMVMSRPEPDINEILQTLDERSVDLAEESESDIMIYLEQQLLALATQWDRETRDFIKLTLAGSADGMFRWVALQLMELQTCSNPHTARKQVVTLPKGLHETYDRILLKVNEMDHTDTQTFLRWLCFAVRPLRLSEIAEAISVHFDPENDPHFSPSHRYWNNQDVLKKCSGLIVESEGQIKLAHVSIKEYLLSTHLQEHKGIGSKFHLISDQLSHSLMAQTCLAYLLHFDGFDLVDENVAGSFPLSLYAAEHWIFHAHSGGIDKPEPSSTLTLAKKLFTPKSNAWLNWLRIWDLDKPYEFMRGRIHNQPNDIPPLYYAALAGLEQLSLQLMKGGSLNVQGGRYGNALQAASREGHRGVVKMLLEHGADVNTQNGEYGNALQAAIASGAEGTVKLLLEHGADVNVQGGFYGNTLHGNALQAAIICSQEGMVQLLLQHGADVNVQRGEYGNALQAASARGREGIVKLLLEHGADMNVQGGPYGNTLLAAIAGGAEGTVKLLLEHGMDVNIQGGDYGNALQVASARGWEGIVKMLLEHGADVNVQGGRYGNALQGAIAGGDEGIVKLLLQHGTDVNVQGGEFGNALLMASTWGWEGIVKLLIEHNADVNVQGGKYGNALQAAIAGGHGLIVKLLLERGADANVQGGDYGTALQAASARGREEIVKLLLEHGMDVNVQGGYYGNALQGAIAGGDKEIVKLLLEHGADVNVQGGYYGNALQGAIAGGDKGIVKLVLEHGPDVNVQKGKHGNLLLAAIAGGDKGIAKLLVEHGADVNIRGGEYGNALLAAIASGDEGVVKLLLEHGADVNVQAGEHGNALQGAITGADEGILKLLLQHGADVNVQGGDYGTALQAASARGREEIVKLLLEHGTDVNVQGGYYGNALQAASAAGQEGIVKLLLEHGADVNVQGGDDGNALQAASAAGQEGIVKLLLEHGADVNVQGGDYGNALQAASAAGQEGIVKLLLEHGADPNVLGGDYSNALQAASAGGQEGIVKLLLEHGADPNVPGGEFGDALQVASFFGYQSIVQLLMEHGASAMM